MTTLSTPTPDEAYRNASYAAKLNALRPDPNYVEIPSVARQTFDGLFGNVRRVNSAFAGWTTAETRDQAIKLLAQIEAQARTVRVALRKAKRS